MTEWLTSPSSENKFTCNNIKILDIARQLDEILDTRDEYSSSNRGLPPGIDELDSTTVAKYAEKYFADPQGDGLLTQRTWNDFTAWCEGTKIGEMFLKSNTESRLDNWDAMIKKATLACPNLQHNQLAPITVDMSKKVPQNNSPAITKMKELIKQKNNSTRPSRSRPHGSPSDVSKRSRPFRHRTRPMWSRPLGSRRLSLLTQ